MYFNICQRVGLAVEFQVSTCPSSVLFSSSLPIRACKKTQYKTSQ